MNIQKKTMGSHLNQLKRGVIHLYLQKTLSLLTKAYGKSITLSGKRIVGCIWYDFISMGCFVLEDAKWLFGTGLPLIIVFVFCQTISPF